MNGVESSYFVAGGTLRPDAPSYIERSADKELFERLLGGEFCYVLTSRQMGKSSLMVRTASRLRAAGRKVVVVDLTAFGQNLTPEQWYEAIAGRIARQLDLEDEFDDYWDAHRSEAPMKRLFGAMETILLGEEERRSNVVLFFDEIDVVRSLPFEADEFFAGVRNCFERRATEPGFCCLTFCMLGIASPADLVINPRTTPFQLGHCIELTDFTSDEALQFARGIGCPPDQAIAIVNRILYWTGGHPYLTQVLCQKVVSSPGVTGPVGVDRLCERQFLSAKGREEDDNLMFVREWLVRNRDARSEVVGLYHRIHRGRSVKPNPADPRMDILRLSGVIKVQDSEVRVRNRIYHRVFDTVWIHSVLPSLAVSQKRRRLMASSLKFGAIGMLLAGLLWSALDGATAIRSAWNGLVPTRSGLQIYKSVPPRSSDATPNQLDLASEYTALLEDGLVDGAPTDNLSEFKPGLHRLGGVLFDARAVLKPASTTQTDGRTKPGAWIRVARKIQTLHFLHAASNALDQRGKSAGSYRMEFENGEIWEVPLVPGRHFKDWRSPLPASAMSDVKPAWTGSRPLAGGNPPSLYVSSWTNPVPHLELRSIRVDADPGGACPIVMAITVEPWRSP